MRNRFTIEFLLAFALLLRLNFSNHTIQAQCGPCQYAVNLVTNGNFSSGNNGFTTSLTYSPGPIFFCPLCSENTYAIGANASLYHNNFTGNDHTNPPNGNFFIANGPGQANVNVWCQTMTVQPNTLYTFSFWARDVTNNSNPHPYAILQASFNGVLDPITVEANGGWEQYTTTWNSGNATTLQLCIVNQQSNTGGNDFGLDDISLTGCQNYHLAHPANAGPDVSLCNGQSVGIGSTSNAGYQYTWNQPSVLSNAIIANPNFIGSNTTLLDSTFALVVTRDSANLGCLASDTVLITIHPMPAFTLGSDLQVCPDDSVSLGVDSGWDGVLWSNGSSLDTISVSSGTWSATVQLGNCTASDEILITDFNLTTVEFGPDQTICSNVPLVLHAGIMGNWNTGAFSDSLLVESTGMYSFSYSQGNCGVSDSIYVTVQEAPILNLGNDTLLCPGDAITLAVSNSWNTIQWQDGSSNTSITTNDTLIWVHASVGVCSASDTLNLMITSLPLIELGEDIILCGADSVELHAGVVGEWNASISSESYWVDSPGEVTFSYSEMGCVVRDTVMIEVNVPPVFLLSETVSACQGEMITLNAGVSGSWNTGAVGSSIEVFAEGVYIITVTNGPCIAEDSTTLVLSPLPFVNLPPSVLACDTEPFRLDAEYAGNASYLWSSGEIEPSILVDSAATYWVEVSNACGSVRDSVDVAFEPCDYGIFVPSCFTPNDDPHNEGWVVQGYHVSDIQIIVYNKFGDAIFKANDFGIPWYPSTGIKQDVYNYRIEATTYDGDPILLLGCIYLLR